MGYRVKLAIFPPWKAPVPYETLEAVFASTTAAFEAAEKVLAPITERELAQLASELQSRSERADQQAVAVIAVPESEVHGFVIYDEAGIEVGNWTTLDVAVERASKACPG